MRRTSLALVLLVLGAGEALAGVLVHEGDVGLALALLAPVATIAAVPGGWWSRLPFASAWVGVVLVFARRTGEGDLLVSADVHGYALLVLGLLLVVAAMGTLRPLRPTGSTEGADAPPTVPDAQPPRS